MVMAQTEASRQFSFRLPEALVEQIEQCTEEIRAQGLEVSRADVVRLLLNHSLQTTKCKLNLLLRPTPPKKSNGRRRE
jgi:Arc/MetJ-type ribon-helix-helix transcriptional regulator